MKKILIVDDQIHIAKALGYALKKKGYEIYYAKNGVETLEILGDLEPDLILMDIMMPLMTGIEVLKHLKKNNEIGKYPIIMVSARGRDENVEEALSIGAVDFIVKPFCVSDVMDQVDKLFSTEKNEETE